jgi:hypothetical protein
MAATVMTCWICAYMGLGCDSSGPDIEPCDEFIDDSQWADGEHRETWTVAALLELERERMKVKK